MRQAGAATSRRESGRRADGGHSLRDLAALAGCEVAGDPDLRVHGVADPATAGPTDMVFLVESKYRDRVLGCRAGFVLAGERLPDRPGLISSQPRVAMARVMAAFAPGGPVPGVSPGAVVDPSARLGPEVSIGPGAVVGAKVTIGKGTVVHPHVVLYPGVRIGRDCVIHAGVIVREACVLGDRVVVQPGAVVGSDGFGFVPTPAGIVKIPQLGAVVIGDDVEIGANCTIDRGTLGDTVVGRGTKLDNLVHLAHNVRVGEHCMLVAHVGISGSTAIGDRCVFGGQSGAVGHVAIGADVTVAAKSGITKDIAEGQTISGFPARPHREELRRQAEAARLARRLARLEAKLADLTGERPT